jgi:hypothetical protein
MEDILDVYAAPSNPGCPRLCIDERPCQLLGDVRDPLPMQAGQPQKEDYEYKRYGTCCVFLAYDLEHGKRYVQVYKQRTKKEYTEFMQWLKTEHYPEARRIVVVQDNLNTHSYSSFYEQLDCQTAHDLKNTFEFHFTPKHASWLNMAEIEFSALAKQCLDRRIDQQERLEKEVLAWASTRNEQSIKIDWSFTTQAARQKLQPKYQKVNPSN